MKALGVEIPEAITGRLDRTRLRAVNGLRLLAGLDRPGVGCTPHTVVWSDGRATMRRYRAGVGNGSPILLVPSLVNRSYIWDLRPGDSVVELLIAAGHDVYLLDWGEPDARDASASMSRYTDDYLQQAFDRTVELSGEVPIVIGHCFGGLIALLWAASNPPQQPRALITIAAPTNWSEMGPLSWLTQQGRIEPEDILDDTGNVPPDAMLRAFQMIRPLGDVTGYVTMIDRLHDRQATQAIWALTHWAHDHVPFPGGVFVEMIRVLNRDNALVTGKVMLGGKLRSLDSITTPFLNIYGTTDHVTPPASVAPLTALVGTGGDERVLKAGHVGLLVGGSARKKTVPAIVEWLAEKGT
ncbi:alpha/beta fold hydrolase [Gordonia sp. TBRC 11910]|uniref:Alpha/beta fold hydrolase n=1 Tax=Gordonia asplenii TaxID=2725283 RepID=A0A848L4V8_9ACTN|nr:alpha/beta fold hydrolase [Gordonia asplenii]NMO02648.1 alpha/beta fold hydrolase [Gordonia asplenii]